MGNSVNAVDFSLGLFPRRPYNRAFYRTSSTTNPSSIRGLMTSSKRYGPLCPILPSDSPSMGKLFRPLLSSLTLFGHENDLSSHIP